MEFFFMKIGKVAVVPNLHFHSLFFFFEAVIKIEMYLTGSDYKSSQIETNIEVGKKNEEKENVKTGYKYFTLPIIDNVHHNGQLSALAHEHNPWGFAIHDDLNSSIGISWV